MSAAPLAPSAPAKGFTAGARPAGMPGLRLTLGITLLYLGLLVLLPLSALIAKSLELTGMQWLALLRSERVMAALRLSFGAALTAAVVNAVFGLLIAWVLVRHRFPGRRLFDTLIDLPFALPTAVAGIALTTLFAPAGWIGRWLALLGINVSFQPLGICVALIFTTLPFVVRTLQPVLADAERELEEAARSLGANGLQTFMRVVMPAILPAWLTGFALAFARATGEYGSVIFIAGNLPLRTEIAPLLIYIKLEQSDYAGATALACIMLALSFIGLLAINGAQAWARRRTGAGVGA